MKSGIYNVKAKGHGSSFMPMKVVLSKDKIEKIDIDSSGETKGVADEVFKRLPQQIIDGQTLNVDTISGATISSHGVIDGVAEAIDSAGGKSIEWKKRPKPVSDSTQDKEYTTDVVVIGAGGAGLVQALEVLNMGKM